MIAGPLLVALMLFAAPVDPAPAIDPAAAGAADALAPVTVTTRVVPDPSHVGDLLTLEVTAAFARGYSVNLPIGVKFDPLHLVEVVEGNPEATGEGLRKTFSIRLQHFAPGPAQVPGFALTYVDPQGAIQTVTVPPTGFTVDALLANEAEPERKLEDPPISIDYPNTLAETIVYSVLATLVGATLVWLVLRRFWRRRRATVLVPAIPAHLVALGALDELERSTLLADGLVQDYYVQLTEIGKGYVERRFGIDALDRTTDEIRDTLRRDPNQVAPLAAGDIVEFLDRSDLVKFARMQPDQGEAKDALGFVRDLVERSVPTASPAPEPANDGGRAAALTPPDAGAPAQDQEAS